MQQDNQFSIIPAGDDLEHLARHLEFLPVQNASPKRLSPQQVDQFNRLGFLSPLAVFSADEMTVHRDFFDSLLDAALAEGKDSYSISTAHLKHGHVYDLLHDARIVDFVSDLLGCNVIGWGSHYFCKMPHDGKSVAWHQDASYWPLTPSRTVTVWLAIDDADRENACVQFLPASHREGHLKYRASDQTESNVLDQTVEDVQRFGEPYFAELRAGEISLHSDLLLHGSEANDSDRRRCGLTLRYCTPDVRAHLRWNEKGVVVRGCDASGHWSNPPRPE